jgi:hypothetical protein
MSERGWELVATNETPVLAKPSLGAIVVEAMDVLPAVQPELDVIQFIRRRVLDACEPTARHTMGRNIL